MAMFMVKPWSGLTLGRERRSVERTKKLPWKVCRLRPERERERERERE